MIRTAGWRLASSSALLAAWMLALFSGVALLGGVHLLLAAALLLFPWRHRDAPGPAP